MVADFSKLLSHPDKDEIISKLMTGISPKNVADWLKLKYADKDQQHLRISIKSLKDFVDNNLDLYSQLRNDIESAGNGQKAPKGLSESLSNCKTYQERINELADKELDIKKIITETVVIVKARAMQVFDKIQENPSNTKPDYVLIKWFETLINASEKFEKIVNEKPDQVVQHNISVQMIENHTTILQEAIRDTMMEIDPEIAFLFMEKFTSRMTALQEPTQNVLGQDKRLAEAKVLSTSIANDEETE
jgi:hypothetical protein